METQRIIHIHTNANTETSSSSETPEDRSKITIIVISIIVLIFVSVYCFVLIWQDFKDRFPNFGIFSFNKPKPNFIGLADPTRRNSIFDHLSILRPVPNDTVVTLSDHQPIRIMNQPNFPIKEESEDEEDLKKIGIYNKKESRREFKWLKNLDGVNFVFPNITKKLKSNEKQQSYTESVFIKNHEFTKKSKNLFGYFPVPINQVKKAKIIGFSGNEVIIPISHNEPKFALILPIDKGLSITIEKDEDLYDETKTIDEPMLIRTSGNITISQTEKGPKQFVIFYLKQKSIQRKPVIYKSLRKIDF